jgi:hypothetical protein
LAILGQVLRPEKSVAIDPLDRDAVANPIRAGLLVRDGMTIAPSGAATAP